MACACASPSGRPCGQKHRQPDRTMLGLVSSSKNWETLPRCYRPPLPLACGRSLRVKRILGGGPRFKGQGISGERQRPVSHVLTQVGVCGGWDLTQSRRWPWWWLPSWWCRGQAWHGQARALSSLLSPLLPLLPRLQPPHSFWGHIALLVESTLPFLPQEFLQG